jgi:hypothetical protein
VEKGTAMPNCEVFSYCLNTLVIQFAKYSNQYFDVVYKKPHTIFIDRILTRLSCASIVVEHNYVDRDYLEDYVQFHAASFSAPPRICARLHFFSRDLTGNGFESIILSNQGKENPINALLGKYYLGFCVIRPESSKFIGRICLDISSLDSATGDRCLVYPLRHDYDVGLFGHKLTVKNTVAFQEQDSIVSACATCAVWFAMHAQGNHHLVPSPGSITRRSTTDSTNPYRIFPNKGLDFAAISRALKRERYEPIIQDFKSTDFSSEFNVRSALRLIYAYLRGGVAAALVGVDLYGTPCGKTDSDSQARTSGEAAAPDLSTNSSSAPDSKPSLIGKHAITVLGYELERGKVFEGVGTEGKIESSTLENVKLIADDVSALSAHDDQLGPFCEFKVQHKYSSPDTPSAQPTHNMSFSYPANAEGQGPLNEMPINKTHKDIFLLPSLIALTAYHKIVLQFNDVLQYIGGLHNYFYAVYGNNAASHINYTDGRSQVRETGVVSGGGENAEHNKEALDLIYGPDKNRMFIWDVYVSTATKIKSDIRNDLWNAQKSAGGFSTLYPKDKLGEILFGRWSKYTWRATAYSPGYGPDTPLFDFIIDATDVIHGKSLLSVFFYQDGLEAAFRTLFRAEEEGVDPIYTKTMPYPLINALIRKLNRSSTVEMWDADRLYGSPQPPRKIQAHEQSDGGGVIDQRTDHRTKANVVVFRYPRRPENRPFSPLETDCLQYPENISGEERARFRADKKGFFEKRYGGSCLWVIDRYCNVIIADEFEYESTPKRLWGHPTLTGGREARIAGELHIPLTGISGEWRLNNASGRYTRFIKDRVSNTLEEAKKLIEHHLKGIYEINNDQLLKMTTDWIENNGIMRITGENVEYEIRRVAEYQSRSFAEKIDLVEAAVTEIFYATDRSAFTGVDFGNNESVRSLIECAVASVVNTGESGLGWYGDDLHVTQRLLLLTLVIKAHKLGPALRCITAEQWSKITQQLTDAMPNFVMWCSVENDRRRPLGQLLTHTCEVVGASGGEAGQFAQAIIDQFEPEQALLVKIALGA